MIRHHQSCQHQICQQQYVVLDCFNIKSDQIECHHIRHLKIELKQKFYKYYLESIKPHEMMACVYSKVCCAKCIERLLELRNRINYYKDRRNQLKAEYQRLLKKFVSYRLHDCDTMYHLYDKTLNNYNLHTDKAIYAANEEYMTRVQPKVKDAFDASVDQYYREILEAEKNFNELLITYNGWIDILYANDPNIYLV